MSAWIIFYVVVGLITTYIVHFEDGIDAEPLSILAVTLAWPVVLLVVVIILTYTAFFAVLDKIFKRK